MIGALDISTSALVAQRTRMDVIAGNVAMSDAVGGPDGEPAPYRRRVALFEVGNPAAGRDKPGVHVSRIVEDPSPGRLVHDPGHPFAAKSGPNAGYVRYPNVSRIVEMVDAIEASRAYEANLTVIDVTKNMLSSTLRLLA